MLAYQGFPWRPAPAYVRDAPSEGRRYSNGASYPAWHEMDEIILQLPRSTLLSFHLCETEESLATSSTPQLKSIQILILVG